MQMYKYMRMFIFFNSHDIRRSLHKKITYEKNRAMLLVIYTHVFTHRGSKTT